jgi:hypothetical protein
VIRSWVPSKVPSGGNVTESCGEKVIEEWMEKDDDGVRFVVVNVWMFAEGVVSWSDVAEALAALRVGVFKVVSHSV